MLRLCLHSTGKLVLPTQKSIRYSMNPYPIVIPRFRNRRDAAPLRYRNRAQISVLKCEQKPYPVCWQQKLSCIV